MNWIKAALIRAIRTFAQVAVSMITVGTAGFGDIDWLAILSVAGVAAVYSVLTSMVSLPEVDGWVFKKNVGEFINGEDEIKNESDK